MLKIPFRILRYLNPIYLMRRLLFILMNRWRRRTPIDYVSLLLPAEMPTLPQPTPWLRRKIFGSPPLSLTELDRMLERIGDDPRPKGVILHLRGFALPLAGLQTLRTSLLRLRAKGKMIICFAPAYDNATYYIASVAHEIVLQPGGELNTIGLRREATFLKDALAQLGIQLDSVAISPYKGAFDQFTRSSISPEGQEQLEWLLDSQFDMITHGIAEARSKSDAEVRTMIDTAPHLDQRALAAGYIDFIETEENLHRRLNSKHILTWARADKKLLRKWPKRTDRFIALLNVSGMMVQGTSGRPPVNIPIPFVGGERSGDLTVVQQVRQLMLNESIAAVILYINSGGGSASAAEAMTAALQELARKRPLIAFMDGVAASGGYYIATAAQWIIAQPGTITGSIGVIAAKPVTQGIFDRLRINRLSFTRGANAALQSDHAPYTDEQRSRVYESIQHIYQQFVQRVSVSRNLTGESVHAVAGGRVWTGLQAKEHGLVDELGDLQAARAKAASLASLPADTPLVVIGAAGLSLPPQLAPAAGITDTLQYVNSNVKSLTNGTAQLLMPFEWK